MSSFYCQKDINKILIGFELFSRNQKTEHIHPGIAKRAKVYRGEKLVDRGWFKMDEALMQKM